MSGESEEDVITQVQNIESEDPVSITDQSVHDGSFTNATSEPVAAAETNAVSSTSCSAGATREEQDISSTGHDVENNPADQLENISAEQTLAPADETPACGDSGHPPADDACDDAENTDPGSISIPPCDAISQQESEISISQLVVRGRARDKSQQSMQAKLQEAIDKVEQLDRSLEKKLKENLEAKAVTADLRALVRRELAELSGARGGRHATREETDNTMQFLRVLVDNDSESETSSLVTPIFQTQVRFGREGPPRSAEDVHPAGTQPDPEHPMGDSSAGEMPPPPPPGEHQQPYAGHHRPPHDQYFIRRNIELAQEAGGSLAMTEDERLRLEHLLTEDDDQLENAFSIDEQHRRLLLSLDDRLSSLGASASAPGGSSSLVSGPAGGGGDGSGGGQAADAPAHAASEQDYLEATRHDRETSARLESLHRRLERLAEPVEVRPLDRCDVDSMIQETITSLMSAPCGGRSDLTGAAASASLISVPSQTSTTVTGSEGTVGAPSSDGLPGAPSSIGTGTGGGGGGPGSEAPTEATLDVRSVLSGTRLDENERQLAAELRPGSPSAWLVDVTQGQQRLQLVVPRLSRQLIAALLESGTVLPPDHGDTAGLSVSTAAAVPAAALSPAPRPVSAGVE